MKHIKVFGVGFHKTGTTSLGIALEYLGYRVCGPIGVNELDIRNTYKDIAFPLVDKYDAFQDNPWPLLYKELDIRHPGSKFILTIRPSMKWIESVVKHFGLADTPMRELIYGAGYGHPEGNEDLYIERYERHNREVMEYFKNRENDLLVFKLTEGDGWEKLCKFLNEKVPDKPFPVTNTAKDRNNLFVSMKQKIKRFI